MAEIVREAMREGNERAQDMFGHGNFMYAAGVGDFDTAAPEFGVHQLPDPRSGGMKPEELAGPGELFGAQRETDEDVRIRKLGLQAVVSGQMHDPHFRPAISNAFSHTRRRIPERETVPDADEQLCFGGNCSRHWIHASDVSTRERDRSRLRAREPPK